MRIVGEERKLFAKRNVRELVRISESIVIASTARELHVCYIGRDEVDTLSTTKVAPDATGAIQKLLWVNACSTLFVLQGEEIFALGYDRSRDRLYYCSKVDPNGVTGRAAANAGGVAKVLGKAATEGSPSSFYDFDVRYTSKTIKIVALTNQHTVKVFVGDQMSQNLFSEHEVDSDILNCRWTGEFVALYDSRSEELMIKSLEVGNTITDGVFEGVVCSHDGGRAGLGSGGGGGGGAGLNASFANANADSAFLQHNATYCNALLVCPLNDSMSYNNTKKAVTHNFDEIAIVHRKRRTSTAHYFPFMVTILHITKQGDVSQTHTFELIAHEEPSCITSFGPWLLVANGDIGMDVYNWGSGSLVATYLETELVANIWTTSRAVDHRPEDAQLSYHEAHNVTVMTLNGLCVVQLPSIAKIVAELSLMMLEEAQHFMKYGHSIGIRKLMEYIRPEIASKVGMPTAASPVAMIENELTVVSEDGCAEHSTTAKYYEPYVSSAVNIQHAEFLSLLAQFAIIDRADPEHMVRIMAEEELNLSMLSNGSVGSNSPSPPRGKRNKKNCQSCGKKFTLVGKPSKCMLCMNLFCKKCIRKLSGFDMGYDFEELRCCISCNQACNRNLYTLLMNHKYREAMHYFFQRLLKTGNGSGGGERSSLKSDRSPSSSPRGSGVMTPRQSPRGGGCSPRNTSMSPEALSQTIGIPLERILEPVMYQCFEEGRFELCAEIATEYVSSGELWESWIMKFTMKKRVKDLARTIPSPEVGREIGLERWMYTTILSQLIKTSGEILNELVSTWNISTYDFMAVAQGIESYLKFKQQEALATQRHCTMNKPHEDRNFELAAIGHLYFDPEVRLLIHALLRLYGQAGLHHDAIRSFVDHFIDFTPTIFSSEEIRPRAPSIPAFFSDQYDINGSFDYSSTTYLNFDVSEHPCMKREMAEEPYPFDVWRYMTDHDLSDMLFPPHLRGEECQYKGESILPRLVTHKTEQLAEFLIQLVDDNAGYQFDVMAELVTQLKSTPQALLSFLDAVSARSVQSTQKFHSLQAELYIEHMPQKLLSFIRNPSVFDIDWRKLVGTLQSRRMFAELAYVAGKMGNDKEAIRIAIRCLKNIPFAIEYVEESGDNTLWNELVANVLQNETMIGEFLQHGGGHYKIQDFLAQIPDRNRLKIPRESERLTRIMKDTRLDTKLNESCVKSLEEDNLRLLRKWKNSRNRAVRLEGGSRVGCELCGMGHSVDGFAGCGHQFHTKCFESHFGKTMKHNRKHLRPGTVMHSGVVPPSRTEGNRAIAESEREALRRSDPLYASTMYEMLKEDFLEDPVDLLPRRLIFDIFSFVGRTDLQRGAQQVSQVWRHIASAFLLGDGRLDMSLYQRHSVMQLKRNSVIPVDVNIKPSRVVFGPLVDDFIVGTHQEHVLNQAASANNNSLNLSVGNISPVRSRSMMNGGVIGGGDLSPAAMRRKKKIVDCPVCSQVHMGEVTSGERK